jgi:hypothetical protein
MPSLFSPKSEDGRAILLEAYAGTPILGVRTSRYLYTEWHTGDTTGPYSEGPYTPAPEKELYDTYVDPYQLDNRANDPNYGSVVAELGDELDDLIDCAGPDCRTAPTGNLSFTNAGSSGGGCMVPPITASFTPDPGGPSTIVGVTFYAGGTLVSTDSEAPYEAVLPDAPIRAEEPKSATVLAEVLYTDGRRLTLPAKIHLCP